MPFDLYQYNNFDIFIWMIFMLEVLHWAFLLLSVLVVCLFVVLIRAFSIGEGTAVG